MEDRFELDVDGQYCLVKSEPTEILTPDSQRWGTFVERLESWLSVCGCDGDTGDHVHRCAKVVMHKMGGINTQASLAYFEDHGGYCDCEILLNVDPDARIFR